MILTDIVDAASDENYNNIRQALLTRGLFMFNKDASDINKNDRITTKTERFFWEFIEEIPEETVQKSKLRDAFKKFLEQSPLTQGGSSYMICGFLHARGHGNASTISLTRLLLLRV